MPIYEYQCTACGHHLDIMQKITEEPIKTCPNCNKETLRKLISAAGFQLKGTGWYATDFRNKGKREAPQSSTQNDNKESKQSMDKSSNSTPDKET